MKVSVAMATYNGEKYLEEQLMSIIEQTHKPDEIIVSDDGSKDNTMEILRKIKPVAEKNGIFFKIITGNPRKGPGGNFEYALRHCSGDVIFICGQDDVWKERKIEAHLSVYEKIEDAELVVSNHDTIVKGEECRLENNDIVNGYKSIGDNIYKVERKKHLEKSLSTPIFGGPFLSISKSLKERCLPIPDSNAEDIWIPFIAMCLDTCYYLDEKLTLYRIHNSTTQSADISLFQRIKKNIKRLNKYESTFTRNLLYGKKTLEYLMNTESHGEPCFNFAIDAAKEIVNIGEIQVKALNSNRLIGMFILLKLFLTNTRYRKTGTYQFIMQELYLLFRKSN